MILNLKRNLNFLKSLKIFNTNFFKTQLFYKSDRNDTRFDFKDDLYQEYFDLYDTPKEDNPPRSSERNLTNRHLPNIQKHIKTTSELERGSSADTQSDSLEMFSKKKEEKILNRLDNFIGGFHIQKYDDLIAEICKVKKEYVSKDILKEFETCVKNNEDGIMIRAMEIHKNCPGLKSFRSYKRRKSRSFHNKDYDYIMRLEPLLKEFRMDESLFLTNYPFIPLFIEFFESKLESHIHKIEVSKDVLTFTKPEQWYPQARNMKRKIYYHMGPTNSGKTSYAIKKLTEAKTGLYCAPLRLLAGEVRQKLVDNGVKCSLLTGQEKIFVSGQTHLSMTVEKTDLNKYWDVAVIDEIQMIEDDQRGSAWTTALLGIKADEIHICGDERAFKLVYEITRSTGDELFYKKYKRFSTLKVEDNTFAFGDLKQGDCIIGFSKDNLIKYKGIINNRFRNLNCALIYGDLPPETKKDQAKKFNISDDNSSSYNFLCASDAVIFYLMYRLVWVLI
jgi:hypothetical protein